MNTRTKKDSTPKGAVLFGMDGGLEEGGRASAR